MYLNDFRRPLWGKHWFFQNFFESPKEVWYKSNQKSYISSSKPPLASITAFDLHKIDLQLTRAYWHLTKMKVRTVITSKVFFCQFWPFLALIFEFLNWYSKFWSKSLKMDEWTYIDIFQKLFNSFKTFMDNKRGVSNTPFLLLNFCPFWGHRLITVKATIFKLSKKLLKTILINYEKFHGRG